jgi:hypothetical protein
MVRFLLLVLLLSVGWPQGTRENVGTKVVWRLNGGSFAGGEITEYMMGDRRRTEYHNTAQRRNPDGSFAPADPSANVVIQRCDLTRSFGLNTKTQEYSEKEYPPKPMTPEADPNWDTSKLPAYRVETTTVDTGEREEIFGQRARHVVTTTKTTPLGDTKGEPSILVKDGWYIDYDQRISCDPRPPAGPKVHDFGWFYKGAHRWPMQKIENVQMGERETGLFVKGNQDSRNTTITGSNGVNVTLSNDIQVTEFYKGPLSPVLFDVPTGFKLGDTVLFQ